MSLRRSILDRITRTVPRTELRVTEQHVFNDRGNSVPQVVYRLEKSPYTQLRSVDAIVNGIGKELRVGTDVEPRDTTGDGRYDSIAFINDNRYPDADTNFEVEYVSKPIIKRYLGSYNNDIDTIGVDLSDAIVSKYVNEASGEDLDRIGGMFGTIGQRGGRTDAQYRRFLRSLVSTFNATGSKQDLVFPIAAAAAIDEEDVVIEEDTERTGFIVRIESVETTAVTSVLEDIIQLAKPSGVELLEPPTFTGQQVEIVMDVSSTETVDPTGLGTTELNADTLG